MPAKAVPGRKKSGDQSLRAFYRDTLSALLTRFDVMSTIWIARS
jgi:hypothetical protein